MLHENCLTIGSFWKLKFLQFWILSRYFWRIFWTELIFIFFQKLLLLPGTFSELRSIASLGPEKEMVSFIYIEKIGIFLKTVINRNFQLEVAKLLNCTNISWNAEIDTFLGPIHYTCVLKTFYQYKFIIVIFFFHC